MNLDTTEMNKNRKPTVGILAHAGEFIYKLAEIGKKKGWEGGEKKWGGWYGGMREREEKREREIEKLGGEKCVGGGGVF